MEKGRLSGSTFEFNARLSECNDIQGLSVPMSPADELFCNGRIRPMKLSAVPQKTPLLSVEHRSKAQSSVISKEGNDMEQKYRGRQRLWRNENESCHRCTPNSSDHWERKGQRNSDKGGVERIRVVGPASPFTLPKPRGSWRTWSLRNIFFHRSKSEGREKERDDRELTFSSYVKSSSDKEKNRASVQGKRAQKKKMADTNTNKTVYMSSPNQKWVPMSAHELHYISSPNRKGIPSAYEFNYISSPNRRGIPVSAHELHYTANRAQAEELRRKTFLPYRRGVLGCLGFPSPPEFPQGHVWQPLY